MYTFNFTLIYKLTEHIKDEEVMSKLFEHGCNDATVGFGMVGQIGLAFERQGMDFQEVIDNTIFNIKQALPQANLLEIEKRLS